MITFAEVRSYAELVDALRRRSAEIGMSREELDATAPLQPGYAAKLLAPVPIKGLGQLTLGPVLCALGLKIVLAEDTEFMDRIRARITMRSKKRKHAGHNMLATKKRKRRGFPHGPEFARGMRARQMLNQSPLKRREIARKAARARWRKPRVVEVKGKEADTKGSK